MNKPKNNRKKAETKSNWVEGSVQDFLQLSDADMEYIEMRLTARNMTQEVAALKLHTSQSRLAKMEAGDSSVSLDLLFKSLFSLGVSRKKLAQALC
jgi:predicted XRE-type DNA-binding protein